jgi:hypothetical protein
MGEAGKLMSQNAANRFPVALGRSGIQDARTATARWFVQGFEQPPSGIMHCRDLSKLRRARATDAKIEATQSLLPRAPIDPAIECFHAA